MAGRRDWRITTTRDASDTVELRYGTANDQAPASYLVFLNGRTEWIEKYDYVVDDLRLAPQCGFLTWDHRGQGASGGARAFIDSYGSYASDAGSIVSKVAGDLPYVIMAHSMGGLVALYATLKGLVNPRAMILLSPLLGMPDRPVPRVFAKPSSKLISQLRLGLLSTGAGRHERARFARNRLTHSVERYQRLQQSPYPVPPASFGWVDQTFEALDFIRSPGGLKMLKCPTLVLAGSEESVVDPDQFQAWVQLASTNSSAPVELAFVNGARHELLSEIPKYYNEALAHIRVFLARYLTPSVAP